MRRFLSLFSILASLAFISCEQSVKVESPTLIPQPADVAILEGYFPLPSHLTLSAEKGDANTLATLFQGQLHRDGYTSITVSAASKESETNTIHLITEKTDQPEAYQLSIKSDGITISAANSTGWFYGLQTLRQLLPANGNGKQIELPLMEIKDAPRFAYRGMHLDVSRHFFTIEELKHFADEMVKYKLNKLHLHLTDDQGWRLQIDKYPLLTEKGAWRHHNKQDSLCLERAKEDATFIIPEKNYKTVDGVKMYGGFYTKKEMRQFIQYARERHIEIIPEIDIPGHFMAAVENYPYLSCTNEAGWGDHFSFPACLGKDSSYEFIENVLSEVAELFPSEYIHIGGDEVNKAEWEKCPKCQAAIKKHKLKNEHELQSHFNHHIEAFLADKGKKLLGWDEIVEGGLSGESTVMWWRNWAPHTIRDAAKGGNDVIVTPDFEYYFDFAYSATPLSKTYNFEPIPADYTPEMQKHIIGVQANIWTERIPNQDRLYFMSMPRMLALAETGWSAADDKNYDDFYKRVINRFDHFDAQQLFYHLPPLEGLDDKVVFTDQATLDITIPLDDMQVYYTTDGSAPTQQSVKYTGPVTITESCKVRMRAYRKHVFSAIFESEFEKQGFAEPVNVNGQAGLTRAVHLGKYRKLKDIPMDQKPAHTTIESLIGLGEYAKKENFALIFEGYFNARKDGIYTFYTESDDGDQLYVQNRMVVDNGGSHATRERNGMIALKTGLHPIRLIYRQIGGGLALNMSVKVPGEKKRFVQASDFITN
ncbi:MAG: family 20 glycosylhydrolase [Marinilabiliaceae bacterium]|nr:family 20 glycosylhydrolase [Marinilabiliaceae bacterium]